MISLCARGHPKKVRGRGELFWHASSLVTLLSPKSFLFYRPRPQPLDAPQQSGGSSTSHLLRQIQATGRPYPLSCSPPRHRDSPRRRSHLPPGPAQRPRRRHQPSHLHRRHQPSHQQRSHQSCFVLSLITAVASWRGEIWSTHHHLSS